MKNPRQIAVEALCRVDLQKSWSNLTLDHQLRKYKLDSRDSAFASALFYGVLERLITLDACISAHSRLPCEKLSPAVRAVLRASVYQLLYMDSVPESAAVNEGVELVKHLRKAQAAGYVNGVLRSFLRAGKRVPLPEGPPEAVLAVRYSCPPELVRLWLAGYGEAVTLRILTGSLGRPPLYIRANTCKAAPQDLLRRLQMRGVAAGTDPGLPGCLVLTDTGAVQDLPEFKQGLFHVQDKSSQLCALALSPQPGERILDACAAPGGKAFTLAQIMGNAGELLAADLYPQRAALIEKRAAAMGLSCIRTFAADMTEPRPALGLFDRVLCDAPCSGLGVIRRKPEIKYKPLEEFSDLPDLQYKLLENSAHYCKEGGVLLYSTCTLLPAENEEVAERFLREHPEFAPGRLPELLGGGAMRTLAGEFDADGFFLAIFQKKNGA